MGAVRFPGRLLVLRQSGRFLRIVSEAAHNTNGCIEWPCGRTRQGYGKYTVGRDGSSAKIILTHRLAWRLFNGPIPRGMFVLHSCDNPPCVNVRHLWLGTAKDNAHDAHMKGRTASGDRNGMRLVPGLSRGEANGNARLTGSDVAAMRHEHATGSTYSALGRKYGVTETAAKYAVVGRTWRHI